MALASKIASWTKKRKETDAKIVFEINFVCRDDTRVSGFIIAGADEIRSRVDEALMACEILAAFAGLQDDGRFIPGARRVAFFLEENRWRLGWWTDGRRVVTTEWFKENPPDAEGVLGRPLP